MSYRSALRATLWLPLILACCVRPDNPRRPDGTEIIHPTPENIPEVTDPDFLIRSDASVPFLNPTEWDSVTVGALDGAEHELFGRLVGSILIDGTVFVLDAGIGELRAYDLEGNFMGTRSQHGQGPGELHDNSSPWSVTHYASDQLLRVLGDNLLMELRYNESGELSSGHDIIIPVFARGSCVMGDRVFMHGWDPVSEEGSIHEVSAEGEVIHSFGTTYQDPSRFVRRRITRWGKLACSAKHGILAQISTSIPVMSAYTADGDLLWQARFADIHPQRQWEVWFEGSPGWNFYPMEPGEHRLHSLLTDDSGDFFYAHYLEKPGDERDPLYGPLFRVDVRTGHGEYLGEAGGVDVLTPDVVVSRFNDEFGYFRIYRRKADPA